MVSSTYQSSIHVECTVQNNNGLEKILSEVGLDVTLSVFSSNYMRSQVMARVKLIQIYV